MSFYLKDLSTLLKIVVKHYNSSDNKKLYVESCNILFTLKK